MTRSAPRSLFGRDDCREQPLPGGGPCRGGVLLARVPGPRSPQMRVSRRYADKELSGRVATVDLLPKSQPAIVDHAQPGELELPRDARCQPPLSGERISPADVPVVRDVPRPPN